MPTAKQPQIFLCYAKEDKAQVSRTYRRLRQKGLNPWLDEENLLPGQVWSREIPKAIKESDFVLIFFSETSVKKRGYVQKEFKLALEVLDEIPEDQIFIIPVRLDHCEPPERFQHLHYCDLFEKDGFDQVLRAVGVQQTAFEKPASPEVLLRKLPLYRLSVEDAEMMVRERDFFDARLNISGRGLQHDYEEIERHGKKLVIDHTTGLTWQQSGSDSAMIFSHVHDYIHGLKSAKYGGFGDWRLPTLEEAMSLTEPVNRNQGLFIDPVFGATQKEIWTADGTDQRSGTWVVLFDGGYCVGYLGFKLYVRAVL